MHAEPAITKIGSDPVEFVLRWLPYFMDTSVIDVFKLLLPDKPLERLSIIRIPAGLKHHVQKTARHNESCKNGVPVVLVEVAEVCDKTLILY